MAAFHLAIHNVVKIGINQAKNINIEKAKSELNEQEDFHLEVLKITKRIAEIAETKDVLVFYKENFEVNGIYQPKKLLRNLKDAILIWREESLERYENDEDWKKHVTDELYITDSLYEDIMES